MSKVKMNPQDLNKIVKEEYKKYLNEISEQEEEAAPAAEDPQEAREEYWLVPGEGKIKWKHLLAAWKMTSRGIAGGKSSMDYYNEHAGKSGTALINARVRALYQSMKGGTGIGTNEPKLIGNLANDEGTNKLIEAAYKEYAGAPLRRHIKGELTNAAIQAAAAGSAASVAGGIGGAAAGGVAGLAGAGFTGGLSIPAGVAAGGAAGAAGAGLAAGGLVKAFGKNLQTIALALLDGHKIDQWDPKTGALDENKILGGEEQEPEEEKEEKDDKKDDGGRVAMAVLTGGVIVDRTTGDKFRAWVNKTHPDYARQIDLDPSGPYNNSYIRKAWAQYGEEYKASLKGGPTPKRKTDPKTPETKVEPKQAKVEKEKKENVPVPTFTGSKAMQEYDRAIADLQRIRTEYAQKGRDPDRRAIPEKPRNLPAIMKRYISLKTDYLPADIVRIADKKIEEFKRKKARLTRQETRPSADRKAGKRADRARKQRFKKAPPPGTPARGRVAQAYADDKNIQEGIKTMKISKQLIESMVKEETVDVMKTHRKKINLNEEYTVKSGDSVSKIAQRLGITVRDMIMANPELEKNPDLIRVGQKLVLPVKTYGDIETVADRPSPKPPASVAQRTGKGVKLDRDDFVKMTTPPRQVAMTSDVPMPKAKAPAPQARGWRGMIAKANTPAEVRRTADRILANAEDKYGVGDPQLKNIAKQVRAARADKLSQLASGAGREKAAGRLAKRAGRIGGGDTGVA